MGSLVQNMNFGRSKYKPFVSTWKTDNTSTGSSLVNQIKLPLESSGSYSFSVNWGDGTKDNITTYDSPNVTHTYSVAGTYQVTILGKCTGWKFVNIGDKLKILNILSFGNLNLGSTGDAFFGCTNLNLSGVTDVLDLTNTSFRGAFRDCTSLITINRIEEWDISLINNFNAMFNGASNFNQNIGAWNVSNVTNFTFMFQNATKFNNGGSSDINNWQINTVLNVSFYAMFIYTAFNQPIGNWNTFKVNNMNAMFKGASTFNQNIGNWNVSNVTNFNEMFAGKTPDTFSATNLDAIYNGWSSRSVLANKTITFGTAKYTSASSTGRAILADAPNNWAITDGGI